LQRADGHGLVTEHVQAAGGVVGNGVHEGDLPVGDRAVDDLECGSA